MNFLKSNEKICRICLKDKAIINWNEEIVELSGFSYKDCYYKYTELLESASDPFPQNFCGICSNELRNAYLLFEKAIHSFKILHVSITVKEFQSQTLSFSKEETEMQISSFNDDCKTCVISEVQTSADDEQLIDIEIYPTNDYDNDSITAAENNTKEITNKDETTEPRHLIRITCELSPKDLLKEKASKSYDRKSKTVEKTSKNCDRRSKASKRCDRKSKIAEKASKSCDRKSKTVEKARKKYLCAYCSSTFCTKNNLLRHEATHNENRERSHICPQCGLKVYTKLTLKYHMETHEKNREKKYKCEFCDKAFFNRGGCNIHRRIHLGQMVSCPICSKEYFRQVDLDQHLLKHSVAPLQKNTEKVKYRVHCQYCNKTIGIANWKVHKAIHLGQPQMKCKICEKEYFGRKGCVQHLKRFHRKTRDDYEKFIHYYVDHRKLTPHLLTKQQEIVQSVIK